MPTEEANASAVGIGDHGQNSQSDYSAYANPLYGTGVFRRRVRLLRLPGTVRAELEDCSHGFRLQLEHDGDQVKSITVEALRIPLTTCMEASRPLENLIGCPLSANWMEFQRWMPASANCTHLRDLAWWSLAHGLRDEEARDYEIAVTDEGAKPAECFLWRNGDLVLQWIVTRGSVVAPQEIANRSLLRGFSAWAMPIFQGDAFEAAAMLQRGYLVAGGRRIDKHALAGERAAIFTRMRGVCFTYSPAAVERAVYSTNSERDFTNSPELLLKFV